MLLLTKRIICSRLTLTAAAVVGGGREGGEQARDEVRVNGLLVVQVGARAAPRDEDYIFLASCLLYQVSFLRRVKAWMEVEEHTIA